MYATPGVTTPGVLLPGAGLRSADDENINENLMRQGVDKHDALRYTPDCNAVRYE